MSSGPHFTKTRKRTHNNIRAKCGTIYAPSLDTSRYFLQQSIAGDPTIATVAKLRRWRSSEAMPLDLRSQDSLG
eukprot:3061521-Amphidinium_carterae.1